ncbi:MAG TPA: flagellar biosynthesis anti-sigma factor FlgM [Sphingobium sp.]|nr:flagellar biosynthesis anti-sigma factor FlgM [Sphingobium sp.]
MIKLVGSGMTAAVEAAKLRETAQPRASAPAARPASQPDADSVATPAARMAAQGAPIDSARIDRIKQAISSGQYPVDPDKIAEKMLDLDLPPPTARH